MRIAITGGTGFVGRHLARALVADGHWVALVARGQDRRDASVRQMSGADLALVSTSDEQGLLRAFGGCDAVAHLAGINRQIRTQTYRNVHIEGTKNVVRAAQEAGARKVVLLSFLRARPHCGSGYHESKWAAEEIVRNSGLDYTILKPGVIYGKGDHMLDHMSRALHTFPIFPILGPVEHPIRPVAVEDVVRIMKAALVEGRLSRQTVYVLGPKELTLREIARRVARVARKRIWPFRMPVAFHYALAWWFERLMTVPLVSLAQVRILAEGVDPGPAAEPLPEDLLPRAMFTEELIRRGLPEPRRFGWNDLRCASAREGGNP